MRCRFGRSASFSSEKRYSVAGSITVPFVPREVETCPLWEPFQPRLAFRLEFRKDCYEDETNHLEYLPTDDLQSVRFSKKKITCSECLEEMRGFWKENSSEIVLEQL